MSTTVRVRPAGMADAEALWPLVRDFATSFEPRRDAFAVALPRLLDRDDTLLVVAEEDDEVVGYLLASAHDTFLANGPVAWVEELMVAAEHRRRGVGRAMLHAAEAWAETAGAAYVSLATRRASAFYAALGYEESAVFFRKALGEPHGPA